MMRWILIELGKPLERISKFHPKKDQCLYVRLVSSEHESSGSESVGHRTQNVELLKNHSDGIVKFQ
jgi:hypothetical protein